MGNYTRFEWRRFQTTLVSSGEDTTRQCAAWDTVQSNGWRRFQTTLVSSGELRCLEWTPDGECLVSGDATGIIKYSDKYLMSFQNTVAHEGAGVKGVTFASSGLKFASCGDEATAKVKTTLETSVKTTSSPLVSSGVLGVGLCIGKVGALPGGPRLGRKINRLAP